MAEKDGTHSRIHDLFGAFLGTAAAGVLISTYWQVDTSGPDPFYKGPLIYPLLVLSLIVLASVPSAWRLVKPHERFTWMLDGGGFPYKPLMVFLFLVAFLCGLVIIGLRVSCLLFVGTSLYYLGHRRPGVLVLIPVIMTGLIFILFKFFLDIYFPTPLILDWFGG
jgi:hypothetical protein